MKRDPKFVSYWARVWFGMTLHERLLVTAVAVILLIGATARYFYLKKQVPTPYDLPQLLMDNAGSPQGGMQGVEHE